MAERSIEARHTYDQAADVLYVNFGDGEPTFAEELEEDFVILEIGWFSGLPKGFRIIGPKKQNLTTFNLQLVVGQIQKEVTNLFEEKIKTLREQEPIMAKAAAFDINQFLAQA